MRNITTWQEIPARASQVAPFPPTLEPRLAQALMQRGLTYLYTHQAEALTAAQAGANLVIVTATASGKTLCYNLPVLDTLLRQPQARALYLFPTKALAQDQLAELDALLHAASLAQPVVGVATYDGDTPRGQRRTIRSRARLLLTNPDMLHTGILPNHPQWAAWFAQLRFIVLDELHTYRGVFGSHVANVLRRLRRICQFYGSEPQFICTSATIGNPQELAERLLAAPVRLIDRDGAPQGARHVILYNPPVVDRALGMRRSSVLEAERVAAAFLAHGVQTIVFARSRLTTELLLTYLRRRAQRPLPTARQQPDAAWRQVEPDSVRGYRGGYLPAERRAIEAGLRNGQVRAVVATNALELGVDIGQLGAAVLTGFPGTIASAWQQMGRAGRRQGVAASVLIAGAGALDQYVINHPRYFFETSPERAYINPDNLVILLNHLQCAAFELPLATDEIFGQVAATQELLAFLAQQGLLHQSGEAWHWMSQAQPSLSVSLRAAGNDTVTITVAVDDAAAEPEAEAPIIGVLDRFSAPLLLHEGAIYLHEGSSYLVTRLDWAAGKAYVQPASLEYYTEASSTTTVLVQRVEREERLPTTLRSQGDITVTTKPTTYRKVRLYTQETLGAGVIDLPEQSMDTTAYWLSLPDEIIESLRGQGLWWGEPILDYGPNWQEQRARVRARDGYRCTVCGLAETPERQHDVHHLTPFRFFGYVPGPPPLGNEAYLEANRLENLTTLCRTCHRRAELLVHVRSGLAGLAYALVNVAPLHLMCDPRDLGVTHDFKSQHNGLPTITLYDRIPGGIGLAAQLFELHTSLLQAARDLVMACGCEGGCPACVGPNQETLDGPLSTRQLTMALLDAILL
jgi:DEAD/DEAH box helicase domain-containing protein